MRCDHLPSTVSFRPDIGEAVMVFVGLAFGSSSLVIEAGNDGGVAVRVDVHIRLLGEVYVHGRIGGVGDVTLFAVGVSVLNGDDEIFRQEGREDVDIAFAVGVSPSLLKTEDIAALRSFLSRGRRYQEANANSDDCQDVQAHESLVTQFRAFCQVDSWLPGGEKIAAATCKRGFRLSGVVGEQKSHFFRSGRLTRKKNAWVGYPG